MLARLGGRMRVTKVGTTQSCAVCERTLLMGERAVQLRSRRRALSSSTSVRSARSSRSRRGGSRRARRRRRPSTAAAAAGGSATSSRSSVSHAPPTRSALAQQEPILRRLSDGEVALLEAADLFNGSAYRRTVGGIAKSLGEPNASIVPLSGTSGELAVTVAWELSWYQYRVSPDSAPAGAARAARPRARRARRGLQGLERAGRGRGPARPRDRSDLAARGTSRA